jgi:hypothetical protein
MMKLIVAFRNFANKPKSTHITRRVFHIFPRSVMYITSGRYLTSHYGLSRARYIVTIDSRMLRNTTFEGFHGITLISSFLKIGWLAHKLKMGGRPTSTARRTQKHHISVLTKASRPNNSVFFFSQNAFISFVWFLQYGCSTFLYNINQDILAIKTLCSA